MSNIVEIKLTPAEPGSISHGTMRPEDLAATFIAELTRLESPRAEAFADEWKELERMADTDGAYDFIAELFDALNEHAPEGCYFGAHEGDGSDYGFWPSMTD